MKQTIIIGSDHAGFEAKEEIKIILENLNYNFEDVGAYSTDSVDYPVIAQELSKKVLENNSKGILICGSGTGMQIAANKIKGIRAAFSHDKYSAEMARKDNNSNVLTLRSREFDHSKYKEIISTFLETHFSDEERHKRRVELLE